MSVLWVIFIGWAVLVCLFVGILWADGRRQCALGEHAWMWDGRWQCARCGRTDDQAVTR